MGAPTNQAAMTPATIAVPLAALLALILGTVCIAIGLGAASGDICASASTSPSGAT